MERLFKRTHIHTIISQQNQPTYNVIETQTSVLEATIDKFCFPLAKTQNDIVTKF